MGLEVRRALRPGQAEAGGAPPGGRGSNRTAVGRLSTGLRRVSVRSALCCRPANALTGLTYSHYPSALEARISVASEPEVCQQFSGINENVRSNALLLQDHTLTAQKTHTTAIPRGMQAMKAALAYTRTSSAANVGSDKDSERRQRQAIQGFAHRGGYTIAEPDWF